MLPRLTSREHGAWVRPIMTAAFHLNQASQGLAAEAVRALANGNAHSAKPLLSDYGAQVRQAVRDFEGEESHYVHTLLADLEQPIERLQTVEGAVRAVRALADLSYVQECDERAKLFYEQALRMLEAADLDRANVQALRVEVLLDLADLARGSDDCDQAADLCQKALVLAESAAAHEPAGSGWHRRLGRVLNALGILAEMRNDNAAAERYFQRDLEVLRGFQAPDMLRSCVVAIRNLAAVRQELYPDGQESSLAELWREAVEIGRRLLENSASVVEDRRELAQSLEDYATCESDALTPQQRAELMREAAELQREVARETGDAEDWDLLVDRVWGAGVAAWEAADVPAAERLLREHVQMWRMRCQDGDGIECRKKLAAALEDLCRLLLEDERVLQALPFCRERVEQLQQVLKREPGDIRWQLSLARAESELGLCLAAAGHKDEALNELCQALRDLPNEIVQTPDAEELVRERDDLAELIGDALAKFGQNKRA